MRGIGSTGKATHGGRQQQQMPMPDRVLHGVSKENEQGKYLGRSSPPPIHIQASPAVGLDLQVRHDARTIIPGQDSRSRGEEKEGKRTHGNSTAWSATQVCGRRDKRPVNRQRSINPIKREAGGLDGKSITT